MMRRRFLLPANLATLVAGNRPPVPLTIRMRIEGRRVLAVEERPDRIDLVVAEWQQEAVQEIAFATGDALASDLSTVWRGQAFRLAVPVAGATFLPAEALVPDGRGGALLDVRAALGPGSESFRLAGPFRDLEEVRGGTALGSLLAPSIPEASSWAVDALRALLAPRAQREALRGALHRKPPPPFLPADPAARAVKDLALDLDRDRALVAAALAPLVAGPDAATYLAALCAERAEALRADGLYVLRLADTGALLGVVAGPPDPGFPAGTTILGPDAPVPACLTGAAALALAAEGRHAPSGGPALGLWSLEGLERVRVQLCGLSPAMLNPGSRRAAAAAP